MVVKATATDNQALYECDFAEWLEETAKLLRAHQWDLVDAKSIAEELDGLARNNRNELRSRMIVLITHLLKWRFQPHGRGNRSWRATVREQRLQIQGMLEDSPSLRRKIAPDIKHINEVARDRALGETKLADRAIPDKPNFTLEEILDDEFWPE